MKGEGKKKERGKAERERVRWHITIAKGMKGGGVKGVLMSAVEGACV